MKTNKIIEFYNQFSIKNLEDLGLFLASSYFNAEKSVLNLHLLLLKYRKKNKLDALSNELIHQSIFPNKKYEDVNIRVLISKLNKLIHQYILIESSKNREIELIQLLRKKNLKKNYTYELNALGRKLNAEIKEENEFLIFSQYYEERNAEMGIFGKIDIEKYLNNANNSIQLLEKYYIFHKLRKICSLYHLKSSNIEKYKAWAQNKINSIQSQEGELAFLPLQLFIHVYSMLSNDQEATANYQKIKAQLPKIDIYLEEEIQREVYTYLFNFCIKKINALQNEYYIDLFELYKKTIQNKLILEEGYFSQTKFINIVQTAIRIDEIAWVEKFIEEQSKYLKEDEKGNAYWFGKSQLFFHKKEYSKVIQSMSKVNFEKYLFGFEARSLLMRAYYESNEFEVLMHFIESFKTFIRRDKSLNQNYIIPYKNFLKLTLTLCQINLRDQAKIKVLKEKIHTLRPLAQVQWLKEKIEKLIK